MSDARFPREIVEDLKAEYEQRLDRSIAQLHERLLEGGDLQYAGADHVAGLQVTVRLWSNVATALQRNEARTDGEPFTQGEVLKACLDALDEKLVDYTPRHSTSTLSNHLDVIAQEQRVDFRRQLRRMVAQAS